MAGIRWHKPKESTGAWHHAHGQARVLLLGSNPFFTKTSMGGQLLFLPMSTQDRPLVLATPCIACRLRSEFRFSGLHYRHDVHKPQPERTNREFTSAFGLTKLVNGKQETQYSLFESYYNFVVGSHWHLPNGLVGSPGVLCIIVPEVGPGNGLARVRNDASF